MHWPDVQGRKWSFSRVGSWGVTVQHNVREVAVIGSTEALIPSTVCSLVTVTFVLSVFYRSES